MLACGDLCLVLFFDQRNPILPRVWLQKIVFPHDGGDGALGLTWDHDFGPWKLLEIFSMAELVYRE